LAICITNRPSREAYAVSWCRFKGVGKKTIACVLMFCLARKEFPVDTHVWRISKSLGWVPAKASREDAYEHLNIRVPADVRCAAPDITRVPLPPTAAPQRRDKGSLCLLQERFPARGELDVC
jgi:endonuclease III